MDDQDDDSRPVSVALMTKLMETYGDELDYTMEGVGLYLTELENGIKALQQRIDELEERLNQLEGKQ